jgi:hypothetical protein
MPVEIANLTPSESFLYIRILLIVLVGILPFTCLFFLMQSIMLSLCVPRKRCAGFTHRLLSHLWQTKSFFGISPLNANQETLWAKAMLFAVVRKTPYPV